MKLQRNEEILTGEKRVRGSSGNQRRWGTCACTRERMRKAQSEVDEDELQRNEEILTGEKRVRGSSGNQ
jgi:hypothetical protein